MSIDHQVKTARASRCVFGVEGGRISAVTFSERHVSDLMGESPPQVKLITSLRRRTSSLYEQLVSICAPPAPRHGRVIAAPLSTSRRQNASPKLEPPMSCANTFAECGMHVWVGLSSAAKTPASRYRSRYLTQSRTPTAFATAKESSTSKSPLSVVNVSFVSRIPGCVERVVPVIEVRTLHAGFPASRVSHGLTFDTSVSRTIKRLRSEGVFRVCDAVCRTSSASVGSGSNATTSVAPARTASIASAPAVPPALSTMTRFTPLATAVATASRKAPTRSTSLKF